MKVKICGITSKEAATCAVESGADFIGFVFADSKRRIDKNKAKQLARLIPPTVKKVGVFVNEDLVTINDIVRDVGLDFVQLHGDEQPEITNRIEAPVIKAFQIRSREDLQKVSDYRCAYYLLDSPAGRYRGGNGEVFNWKLIKHLKAIDGKIIVAGGLHVDNVQQAIAEMNPIGVDVSSGVETAGEKDLTKIAAFIKEAKKER